MAFKAQNEALFKRFTLVKTNEDAWSMGIEAQREALKVANDLAGAVGPEIVDAQSMLRQGIVDVARYVEPMKGAPDAPVSEASWKDLRGAIGRLYNTWWAIEDVLPPSQRHTAWQAWAAIMLEIGQAVPDAAGGVIDYAGDLGGRVVGAAAGAATNVIGSFIKGAWPVLLAAVVVVGGGVYLVATGKVRAPALKVST